MNISKLIKQFVTFGKNIANWLRDWTKTPRMALNLVTITIVVFLAWSWFNTSFLQTEFEFLSGPQKTTGKKYGKAITSTFNNTNGNWLRRDKMSEISTDGFMFNQREIGNDRTGKLVGFGQIGFGDASNTRVLLPLEFNYLHILCSNELFETMTKLCNGCGSQESYEKPKLTANGDPKALTPGESGSNSQNESNFKFREQRLGLFELLYAYRHFRKIARAAPGKSKTATDKAGVLNGFANQELARLEFPGTLRIAAGTPGSGSKYLATRVLDHFGINFTQSGFSPDSAFCLYEDISPKNVQPLLLSGDVDLIFYLGPANSDFVHRFNGQAFLLDLGDHSAAITKSISNTVLTGSFPDGLYGRPIPDSRESRDLKVLNVPAVDIGWGDPLEMQWVLKQPRFCEDIRLLKTRRALICSKRMSNRDAYEIANVSRNALSEDVQSIDWFNLDQPDQNNDLTAVVNFHDGAKLLRDDRYPGIWDYLNSFWNKNNQLFVVAFLSIFFGWFNRFLDPKPAADGPEGDGDRVPDTDDEPPGHVAGEEHPLEDTHPDEQAQDAKDPVEPTPAAEPPVVSPDRPEPVTAGVEFPIEPDQSSDATKSTPQDRFLRIKSSIDHYYIELELEDRELPKTRYLRWQTKLNSLRMLIEKTMRNGKISEDHAEMLGVGFKELEFLFEDEFVNKAMSARR